jgi:hypothetical protein
VDVLLISPTFAAIAPKPHDSSGGHQSLLAQSVLIQSTRSDQQTSKSVLTIAVDADETLPPSAPILDLATVGDRFCGDYRSATEI